MWGKIFFCTLWITLTLFYLVAPAMPEDLFSKAGLQPIKEKKKAPDFSLENLEGRKVELKDFKGKVILLTFWATWCGPCKEDMPSMEALHQQFKGKDFVLLSISVDYAGLKPVKEFLDKHRYTFMVLLDPKCECLDTFGVKGIPTTFLIDKKGTIVGKVVGPKNWKSKEVISLVNMLIESK